MKNLQKIAAFFLIAPTLFAQGSRKAIRFYDKETENRTIFVGYCDVNFNLTTALTVTAWVKWSELVQLQDRWANICSNNSHTTSDDGQWWLQHDQNNTKFEFAVKTVNGRSYVWANNTPIEKGVWYHVAGVYDATLQPPDYRLKIYVNGRFDTGNNNTSGNIIAFDPNYLMKVGCWSFASYRRLFDGVIDEVTVWTRALSAEEIRALMCKKLTGTENGLAGYWDYEEGSGFTAYDKTSGGHHGWIFNEVGKAEAGGTYTLTDNDKNWPTNSLVGRWIAITNGTGFKQRRQIASNTDKIITVTEAWTTIPDNTSYYALTSTNEWCTSTAPVGDASAWDYTGTNPSDFQVTLAHPNGDQVTVTGSGGTITGMQVYRIDAAPDNTTPPTSWDYLDNTRYWGVILYGSNTPTYTLDYNYNGNPNVTSKYENYLGLAYRSGGNRNGLGEPWQNLEAVLNKESKTLSKTGQTGTEYVLIWKEPPVAVKVYDFNAQVTDDCKILLTWRVDHESGIAGYLVYRAEAPNGEYRQISDGLIPCHTEGEPCYQFTDLHVAYGPCSYKLQIVFLDGRKEWYGPVNVLGTSVAHKNAAQAFRLCGVYPNPFNPCTDIQFDLPKDCFVRLQVFDIEGRLVAVPHQGELGAGSHRVRWNAENLPGGIYFIRLSAGTFSAVQRALLLK